MVIDELHIMGFFFLVGTKKSADQSGRAGARWERGGLSQGWSGRGCAGMGGNIRGDGRRIDARYHTYGDELDPRERSQRVNQSTWPRDRIVIPTATL